MDRASPDPNNLLPAWFLDDLFIPFKARITNEDKPKSKKPGRL